MKPSNLKVPGGEPDQSPEPAAAPEVAPAKSRGKPGPKPKGEAAPVISIAGKRPARNLEIDPMPPLPSPDSPIEYEQAMRLIAQGKLKPPVFTDRGYIVE